MLFSIDTNNITNVNGALAGSPSSSTSTTSTTTTTSSMEEVSIVDNKSTCSSSSFAEQLPSTLVEKIGDSLGINKLTLWERCNQSDLIARHLLRGHVYDQAVRHSLTKVHESDVEYVKAGFVALKPFLTGAYADSQVSSEEVDQILELNGNQAARFLYKYQGMVQDFLDTLSAVYAQSMPLPEIVIEAADRFHRPAAELKTELLTWGMLHSSHEFFEWLNAKNPNPRHSIVYLTTPTERAPYIATFINGKIIVNGHVLDTTRCQGKQPGYYAYGVTSSGELLIGAHIQGQFQHSSFTGMGPTLCVGMIKVENGVIVDISNHSGHYRPSCEALRCALKYIPAAVFANKAIIRSEEPRLASVISYGMSSRYAFLRVVGQVTRSLVRTSVRKVQAPLPIVRAIGSYVESRMDTNWYQSAMQFAENHPSLSLLELERFLERFPSITNKLACLGKLWQFWLPSCDRKKVSNFHLCDSLSSIKFSHREKINNHLYRTYYRALLMEHINTIEKNNIIIQLFNEQKRKSYDGDIRELTFAVILTYLERYSQEQRLDQLEQALMVILIYPDFDATETPSTTFCGRNIKFSAKQLQEVTLILQAYERGQQDYTGFLPRLTENHPTLFGFLNGEMEAMTSQSVEEKMSLSSTATSATDKSDETVEEESHVIPLLSSHSNRS
jgi:hypothetical protein